DTAVIRAHQAADWRQFEREKDVLPNLKWMPSTSIHPGADHRIFWGTIRPIDDPFWNEHKPGDRWNCKCTLSSTDEAPTA
ncbi:phage head morphogenesis protein, partial [Phocaeicola dorei]